MTQLANKCMENHDQLLCSGGRLLGHSGIKLFLALSKLVLGIIIVSSFVRFQPITRIVLFCILKNMSRISDSSRVGTNVDVDVGHF